MSKQSRGQGGEKELRKYGAAHKLGLLGSSRLRLAKMEFLILFPHASFFLSVFPISVSIPAFPLAHSENLRTILNASFFFPQTLRPIYQQIPSALTSKNILMSTSSHCLLFHHFWMTAIFFSLILCFCLAPNILFSTQWSEWPC